MGWHETGKVFDPVVLDWAGSWRPTRKRITLAWVCTNLQLPRPLFAESTR